MVRFKKVLAAIAAVMAIGAIAASPSWAGSAEVIVDDGGGPSAPCSVTFNNSGAPPSSPIALSNMAVDPGDPDCEVEIVDGGGDLTIDSTSSTLDGFVEVQALFWTCTYTGNLTGLPAATTLTGSVSTSGFGCPSSATATIQNISY